MSYYIVFGVIVKILKRKKRVKDFIGCLVFIFLLLLDLGLVFETHSLLGVILAVCCCYDCSVYLETKKTGKI
jgi:hypothetical protein